MSATRRTSLIHDWAGPPTRRCFVSFSARQKMMKFTTESTSTRSHDRGDQPRAISHYTTNNNLNITVQKYIRIDSSVEIGKHFRKHFLKIASSFKMPLFPYSIFLEKWRCFVILIWKWNTNKICKPQTVSKNSKSFQRKYLKNKQITKITNTFWDCEQFLVFLENI